jgi:flagellum-specific peptidoglycan hydrolase FlgJ
MDEAFDEYGRLLAHGRAFARARTELPNVNRFADALTNHYATASTYGSALKSNIRHYRLTRYDLQSAGAASTR